jgi:hypothetical protein
MFLPKMAISWTASLSDAPAPYVRGTTYQPLTSLADAAEPLPALGGGVTRAAGASTDEGCGQRSRAADPSTDDAATAVARARSRNVGMSQKQLEAKLRAHRELARMERAVVSSIHWRHRLPRRRMLLQDALDSRAAARDSSRVVGTLSNEDATRSATSARVARESAAAVAGVRRDEAGGGGRSQTHGKRSVRSGGRKARGTARNDGSSSARVPPEMIVWSAPLDGGGGHCSSKSSAQVKPSYTSGPFGGPPVGGAGGGGAPNGSLSARPVLERDNWRSTNNLLQMDEHAKARAHHAISSEHVPAPLPPTSSRQAAHRTPTSHPIGSPPTSSRQAAHPPHRTPPSHFTGRHPRRRLPPHGNTLHRPRPSHHSLRAEGVAGCRTTCRHSSMQRCRWRRPPSMIAARRVRGSRGRRMAGPTRRVPIASSHGCARTTEGSRAGGPDTA